MTARACDFGACIAACAAQKRPNTSLPRPEVLTYPMMSLEIEAMQDEELMIWLEKKENYQKLAEGFSSLSVT